MQQHHNIRPNSPSILNAHLYSEKTIKNIERKKSEIGIKKELSTLRAIREIYHSNDSILNEIFKIRLNKTNNRCPVCNFTISTYYKKVSGKSAYRCSQCSNKIYPMVGTPLEHTHIELTTYLDAIYHLINGRNGYSSWELYRKENLRRETAYNILDRIRRWIALCVNESKFIDDEIIEMDEVYMPIVDFILEPGEKLKRGTGSQRRYPVITMHGRTSGVTKAYPTSEVSSQVIQEAMEWAGINKTHHIVTDESKAYKFLDDKDNKYKHDSCNHKIKQWVNGVAHTNTLEGLHAMSKGATQRTYKGIETDNVEKYMYEVTFRFTMHDKTNLEILEALLTILPPLF